MTTTGTTDPQPESKAGRGAGGLFVATLALRELVLVGFQELGEDLVWQDDVMARVDKLLGNTAAEWKQDYRDQFQRWVTPQSPEFLRVGVGYPQTGARLPYVSVIVEAGSEDKSSAVVGDVLSTSREIVMKGGVKRVKERTARGIDWITTVQIGCWTRAPEASVMMHALVTSIVFDGKPDLATSGVQEVTLADTGFQPDPQLYPDVGYVPVVRCTLRWTRRTTRRRDVPYSYTLLEGCPVI